MVWKNVKYTQKSQNNYPCIKITFELHKFKTQYPFKFGDITGMFWSQELSLGEWWAKNNALSHSGDRQGVYMLYLC